MAGAVLAFGVVVVIAVENAAGIALGVVILIGANRVDEKQQTRAAQDEGDGDKIAQDAHGGSLFEPQRVERHGDRRGRHGKGREQG